MPESMHTTLFNNIPLLDHYPVIWLASWYPSSTYPTNGDFIQRHAQAVDKPLLVIHTVHSPDITDPYVFEVRKNGMITEIILYFRQPSEGGNILNRLQYHWRYLKYTKFLLRNVIARCGKPALIHVHVPMKMGLLATWAKRKWDIPYMVSEQSSKYVGDSTDHFSRRTARHKAQVARIFRGAIAVTNVSGTVGRLLEELFSLRHVNVIYNLADSREFYYRPKPPSPVFHFIHVSTLTKQKNIEGMLRVFSRIYLDRQDFSLKLVGGETGVPARAFDDYPWLSCTGVLPHERVAPEMQNADALVMFSRDENFPCVIAEALCCGLPVITSNAGGSGELIHSGNGIVVQVGDEAALETAIRQMLYHRFTYKNEEIAREASARLGHKAIGSAFLELYRNWGVVL